MDYEMQIRMTALNQASAQIDSVSRSVNNLDNATGKTSSGGVAKFGKSLESLGSRVNVLGQRMTWMVTVPLLAFANKSIETSLEVEKAWLRMNKVFSGTQEELAELKKSAWDVATTYGVSFEEATEAMTEFSKTGIKSKEDLEKLTNLTAKTATLFDTDMSGALLGVKSIMFGFGLTVEQTAQELDAINIIADRTTASEAGVLDMLNRVAGTARAAGFSIREVAAAQAVFEANAIPAGRAGNALKSILTSLNKQSNLAKDQFAELGVNMSSLEWKTSSGGEKLEMLAKKMVEVKKTGDKKIFDNFNKKVGEMSEALGDENEGPIDKLKLLKASMIEAENTNDRVRLEGIKKALDTLNIGGDTSIEKINNLEQVILSLEKSGRTVELNNLNEALASLVGKFQINNLNVLLQDLAKNFDDDESTVSIFASALGLSNDELANAQWGTEQLNKVLDSNVTKTAALEQKYREQASALGEKLLPLKLELLEFLTKLIEKYNALPEDTKKFILIGAGLAVIAGPLLAMSGLSISTLGFVVSFISAISGIGAGTGLVAAGISLGLIAVAISAIATAWAIVKPAYDDLQTTIEGGTKTWDDNNKKIDDYKSEIGSLKTDKANEELKKSIDVIQKHNDELKTMNERYAGLPGVWNAIKDQFAPFINWWKEHWNTIKLSFDASWTIIQGIWLIFWGTFLTVFGTMWLIFTGRWKEGWAILKAGLETVLDGIGKVFAGYVESWIGAIGLFVKNVGSSLNKLIAGFNKLPSWMRGGKEINFKFETSVKASDKSSEHESIKNLANFGKIIYAASGYLARGRDTVPAMLSPGEMVLNKSQQGKLFDILAGRTTLQTAGGPTVNINVGTMVASRGEQREFARRIKTLINEDEGRY